MAFTASSLNSPSTVMGNMRVVCGVLTCSGNGVADSVGLDQIAGFSVAPKSGVTAGIMLSISSNKILATSASTGTDFYIIAFGN